MSRRRNGVLTDSETLRLYEMGRSPHALAELENCSAGAILSRVSRARVERRARLGTPTAQREQPGFVLSGLLRAVERLERQEERQHA